MGLDDIGICALCQKQRELRRSHIIPEFCYKHIYDNNHKLVAFNPTRPDRSWTEQKGLRERLLCDDCEGLLNDRYEKAFKAYWIDGKVLDRLRGKKLEVLDGIDYASFKLFHLSVLFRAHCAKQPPFDELSLGRHETVLRNMLLGGDPGEHWEYPVLCKAIVFDGKPLDQVIAPANRIRLYGCTGYQFVFVGAEWYYFVSSHRVREIDQYALQRNGIMPVAVMSPGFHRPYAKFWPKDAK